MMRLVLVAAVLCGCATSTYPKCRRFEKHNLTICKASPTDVNRICRAMRIKEWDDKSRVMRGQNFGGCADAQNGVAWTAWDAVEPDTSLHEMAHLLNEDNAEDVEYGAASRK